MAQLSVQVGRQSYQPASLHLLGYLPDASTSMGGLKPAQHGGGETQARVKC